MARCSTCHRRLGSGRPCPVHGGAPASAESLPELARPDDPILGVALGELIGAGGFASVWTLGDGRVVKLAHVGHDLARARMAREAEAMTAIAEPAVPRVHATGALADGRAWIAMDRVVGRSIAAITTEGAVKITDAIAIGVAMLDAVGQIHAARFAHRDLKPDNLVRTADGVVVLDLGLARKLPADPDDPTRAGVQVGSLEYMPPEQIADSASVDERSDLYAIGCILYELIAGRPPFVGDAAVLERAHAALRPPRLGALATVPAAIEALVHDLLAKEPARRPATAAIARERLATARDEPTIHTGVASPSIIRASRQPVVLLWVELPRVDRALLAMFATRRLIVASQRGRRVVAGVIGGEHADPATIAIAAARDFAAAGARVALHLDALHVVKDKLDGEAVAQPETWLPTGAWTGIVLTRALAAVVQMPTREAAAGADFRALADGEVRRELVGRDALLGDLVADAAVALGGRGPAFALVVGDAGVGKTALATELAERLRATGVRVHLGTIPAPGSGTPSHAALAVIAAPVAAQPGATVRGIGDSLRAAARERPTAVILDDLHLADHELLDALEYATLGGEPLPLWVLGVASPRLEARRPQLGVRADRHLRRVLAPLDEDAAVALAATLLEPAEYPPLRALRRLVAIAQGNPLHLAMLAREIHDKGAIRERAGGSHFLDTSALDELAPVALGPWLAARELSGLADELVALARLCAVLGDEVGRDELVAIVDAVERAGGATTTIDVDIGLRELVRAGVLVAIARGYRFQQALVEEGVYATTDPDERLALHRAALAYSMRLASIDVRRDGHRIAERIARHAEAVGDLEAAAVAFATLGERAHAEQRPLDADQAWSGALRNLDQRGVTRARALVGRARARYRLQRMHDALADLDAAIEIAEASGDRTLEVTALVEKATVLDHTEDFAGSKAVAARARERLSAADAELGADFGLALDLADARALFREQRMPDAACALRRVLAAALAADRRETATIAALLLGPVLAELRELDEAEAVFADMIERCWAHDDRFHLAAAYGNRAWLWSARGAIDKTEEDLRLVIQLARESGQAHFERVAAYNLGEDRLWQGLYAEAIQLARRSLALQTMATEGSGTRLDRMLLARALAANGELGELRELLATFRGEALAGDELATLALLAAVADHAVPDVVAALGQLAHVSSPNRLELMRLIAADLPPELRAEAQRIAVDDPIWSRRIGEF